MAKQLVDQVTEPTRESWKEWLEGLKERLLAKVEKWSSEHSAIFSRDKLVNDYTHQFNQDLSAELDAWLENQLKQKILKQKMEILDNRIKEEITAIKSDLYELNKVIENQRNTNWVFYKNNESIEAGILGNLGIAGLGAAVLLPAIVFAGPILAFIGSFIGSGLLGTGVIGVLGIDGEIRVKVVETGFQQFVESLEVVFEKINGIIHTAFYDRVEKSENIIANAISFYENLLEQEGKTHEKNLEQRQSKKALISQKRREIEEVQKNIEEILTQYK